MTSIARRISAGSSAALRLPRNASRSSSSPHVRAHTRSTRRVMDPSDAPRSASSSASSARKSSASSSTRSDWRSANESKGGSMLATTSHPAESNASMHEENASARSSSRYGTSSNTTSDWGAPASSSVDTMTPASRSRKKQGLWQSIQNTLWRPKIESAYSKASVDLPNPAGATRNRATWRSPIIFFMSRGRS